MSAEAELRDAPRPDARRRFVVGTMTGTSIDGDLDAALVEIHGSGLAMRATVLHSRAWPLETLADDLRRIATQEALPAREFIRIAHAFGHAHADAIDALCREARATPDLAVLHGQTVFHAPPLTWQLIDPWPTATKLRCRVRYDLRSANTASGGQGAPITPLADFILFAASDSPVVVVNLGGFVNATLLAPRGASIDSIRGYDICACNHLLDEVARTRLHAPFDESGAVAASGVSDERMCAQIEAALAPAACTGSARRSLGTGDEVKAVVGLTAALSAADACRTIVEAIARVIAAVLRADSSALDAAARASERHTIPLLIAGGSARHAALHAALAAHWRGPVQTTAESHGIAVGAREAVGMAILGALADDGVRYALPAVTGARSVAMDSAVIESPRNE